MAEKTTATTATAAALKPPFTARPIPPPRSPTSALSASVNSISLQTSLETGSLQPVLDAAYLIPLTALDSLPTIIGRTNNVVLANDSIGEFLRDDLDLSRLNRIHNLLWMAGRPMRARPLHRYKMMGFDVVHTQQMDLHLLKFSGKLIVKPLPEWILSADFWSEHICGSEALHKSACGFLLSYIWLVVTPLDLKVAHEHTLLPSFVTWTWWKDFVRDFYANLDINSLHQVNRRYQFGDLRLGRINSIYRTRFFATHFVRGYLYGYNRYTVFFQRNFSWILIVFVFFSLVLSAMQVALGLKDLQNSNAFLQASYGFVVFSMVSVVAILALVGLIFATVFFFNMASAIAHKKRAERKREDMWKGREGGKEA